MAESAKKNTKLKLSGTNIQLDLPSVDADGKEILVVDPITNKLGKAVVSVGGGGGGVIAGGVVKVTRSGLPNLTVQARTVADFIKAYFSPAVPITCVLTVDATDREYGASTSVRIRYTVTVGDNPIRNIIVNGILQPKTALTGILDTVTTANTSKTFSMVTTDEADFTSSAQATVTYYHTRFTFQDTSNLLGSDAATVSGKLNSLTSGELSTSRVFDKTYNLNDEYIYFTYPASFGNASFTVGGLPNTAYTYIDFTYTNSYGYSHPYRLYRSGGKGTGSINVKVN